LKPQIAATFSRSWFVAALPACFIALKQRRHIAGTLRGQADLALCKRFHNHVRGDSLRQHKNRGSMAQMADSLVGAIVLDDDFEATPAVKSATS
jgi:hypothetical protein